MIAELIPKIAGMEKRARGAWRPRPSSAGPERCIRQMVYHAAGAPEDKEIGNRFILTMDDSSWHETLTTDWISRTAYQFHSAQLPVDIPAVMFTDNLEAFSAYTCETCGAYVTTGSVHGHIDGIITDLLSQEILLEHKALNHFSFNRYATGETFPLDYITQSCIYVLGASLWNPAIKKALLLIKNKNTAQYLEMLIHYDKACDTAIIKEITLSTGEVIASKDNNPLLVMPQIVGNAVRKMADVHVHAKKRTLPPRPYDYGADFPCGYCSWQETCWKTYASEVDKLGKDADLMELADTARFYAELGAQAAEIKKQRDEIGTAIKAKLTDLQARKGMAGEYIIDWQLREEERVKAKAEIPAELLPLVLKKDMKEVLTVRKFAPKKEKKK